MDANVEAPARPSVVTGICMVAGAVPVVGTLLLFYSVLGIAPIYMGFLFLLYWMGIMHQSMKEFAPSLVGGLAGIGLAWILLALPAIAGSIATYGGVALLAMTLFFFMRGQFRMLINNAMMLFLTVATIPDVKVAQNAPEMAASLLVAAAYSFAIAQAASRFTARRKTGVPAPAPA